MELAAVGGRARQGQIPAVVLAVRLEIQAYKQVEAVVVRCRQRQPTKALVLPHDARTQNDKERERQYENRQRRPPARQPGQQHEQDERRHQDETRRADVLG